MRRDHADANAKELLENLKAEGWFYRRITRAVDRESGIPDAIVARYPKRKTHLLEIKSLGGRLSAAQFAFAREWPGCVHVATNSWEANLLLNECEKQA